MPRQRITESTALRRAREAWHDAALDARREIRARRQPVSRWLDDQAGRRRGDAVVAGITRLSTELAEAGIPADEVTRAIAAAAIGIATAVLPRQQDPGPRAA